VDESHADSVVSAETTTDRETLAVDLPMVITDAATPIELDLQAYCSVFS